MRSLYVDDIDGILLLTQAPSPSFPSTARVSSRPNWTKGKFDNRRTLSKLGSSNGTYPPKGRLSPLMTLPCALREAKGLWKALSMLFGGPKEMRE